MYSGSGGSGSESPRTPVESPDSLVNISYARILDLVSEGEIKGLVDGASSIFLNGTPAQSNGINTFAGFTYAERVGTQSQTYVDGFPQVENNISVGAEIKSDIPYVRAITNSAISSVRVNIGAPRLAKQITSGDNQGDTVGYRVVFRIDVDDGSGVFTDIGSTVFDGKTTTGYQRSVLINLPRTVGTRRIRIRRITANANSSSISDTTNIVSVTEIIDAKLRYPNSAYYAVRFDAQTFGGQIPSRAYLLDGRIISVPTNYDPVARTYDGIWDGTFKQAYTNNPAWVFYDILLHPRYGLGNRITGADIDKWSLYEISRYCDQMVDDGKGGLEPRYTCNCYLQSAADALKVLQDLASVFRGITLWGAGSAYVRADMPRDPIYTYTNANVIDGKFVYKGAPKSTRYSVVDIGWNDPTDQYKIKVERVQHPLAFARYGFQPTNATAFACTSQGQAIRLGKHILDTNFSESNMVSFSAGLDSIHCMPGDVIRIADNFRAGRRLGGRILNSTSTSITCDKVDGVLVGSMVYIAKNDGGLFEREVTAVSGNAISFAEPLESTPVPMAVYSFDHDDVVSQLFRVVSISDNEDGTYSFSCAAYNPNKYDYIDNDIIISQRPITALPLAVQDPPSNLAVESSFLIDQYQAVTKMTISWDKADGAIKYAVEWRRDDNNWVPAGETYNTEIDVYGIYDGAYDIRVKAIGPTNIHSVWETIYDQLLEGKTLNVDAITSINTVSEIFAITVRWQFPASATDSAYTELEYSEVSSGSNPTAIRISYPTDEYTHSGMGSAKTLYFRARLIDKSGNSGPWSAWTQGQSSADADEILDYLTDQISISQLNQELTNEIGQIPSLVENQGDMQQDISDLFDDVDAANQELVDLSQSIVNLNGDITGIESILNQHGIDINTLFNTDQDLEDQINDLQAQLADVISAPEYDLANAYLEGIIVKFDGSLYRALQNVPAGTDPTNTAYWEKIGDYDSLGEVVSSLVVRMGSAESEIDDLDGRVSTNANDILALDSRIVDTENGLEANSQAIESLETSVDIIGDQVTAQSQSVSYLQSSLRDITDYNGYLEDVLNEHDSFAMIREVRTTVVTNEKAQATINLSVQARFNDNEAAFNQEIMTRADADSSLSVRIDSLAARTSAAESAIVNESSVRADADTALANQITVLQSQVNDPATGLPGVVALINAEASTRASADGALSTQINTVQSQVNNPTTGLAASFAAIANEATARSTADGALSTQITNLSAAVTGLDGEIQDAFSAISAESLARANADSALASNITTVQAIANSKNKTYRQASAPTTGMQAGDIWFDSDDNDKPYRYSGAEWVASDDKRIAQNTSAIQTEATARSSADSALATQITNLSAEIGDIDDQVQANAGAIEQIEVEVSEIEGNIQSQATQTTFLYSQYRSTDENGYLRDVLNEHDSFAAVREVRRSFSDESKSQASINLTVSARLNNNESMISQESLARSTADSALASEINTVATMVNDPATGLPAAFAAIQTEETARSSADSALSTQISNVQAQVNNPSTGLAAAFSAISTESSTRASADDALSTQINNVQSQVNNPSTGLAAAFSAIQSEATTRANEDGALSTQINTVQSQVNNPTTGLAASFAAIANEATARSTADGALASDIGTIQSTINDPVTGNAALSTSIQTVSSTLVTMEGDISATYAVKLQQNIGGVITFAGFGLGLTNETGVTQSTFLVNADQFAILNDPTGTAATSPFMVTGGQVYIRDAVIQNASISFAKIQNDIQSDDYTPASTGWKWNKNGNIEINGSQSGTGRVSITNTAFRVYNSSGIAVVELGIL